MKIVFHAVRAAILLLAAISSAPAQSAAPPTPVPDWPVTTAPARFILQPSKEPTVIGWASLYLPDPKWETLPLRVFTDKGVPVGSDVLWSAPGEPTQLLFDCTADPGAEYRVYAGSTWPAMHLTDTQAGVWLETREGQGVPINNQAEMLAAWKQNAGKVVGRALTEGVFEGGNRFGAQRNLLLHMQGWFDLAQPAHLDFATVSLDASFVFIDGKEVVEWPGMHGWGWPRSGPPQGGIDLPAGRHGLDYYNSYTYSPSGAPLLCCLSVKGGAFPNWTTLRRGAGFFRPAAAFPVAIYQLQAPPAFPPPPGSPPFVALHWSVDSQNQSLLDPDLDVGLITVKLSALGPDVGPLTWTFDDGGMAQGKSVSHLFLRPGLREVRVSTQNNNQQVQLLTEKINVRPRMASGPEVEFHPAFESDIFGRDPVAISTTDLVSTIAVFGKYGLWDDIVKLAPALRAKLPGIADADLPYLRDAALGTVAADRADYAAEIDLLRALVDRAAQGKPSPADAAIADRLRLPLARLILISSGQTDEVKKILDAIQPASLDGEEQRAWAILRGDLALATGDAAGARKQYTDLTGQPSGPDLRSSIRRTAKIGQARAFIDQKDYDAAEDALREVAWNTPIEKLSPDWALTNLRLKQEEGLPVMAYYWGRRLLPVIKGEERSELLFRLAGLAFAQKDDDLARKSVSELLKRYPYSAEAAQAKEKWPAVQ